MATMAEETTPMETHGNTKQRTPQRGHGAIRPTRIAAVAVAAAALMTMTVVGASGASVAPGETMAHETHCWTMTPFEDELRLDVALVAPPTVGFYTLFAQWWGAGSYYIEGAGDGQVNHNGTRMSVSWVFFNHTEWASRNRWGRFAASIHLSTLKGPWTLSIAGDGRPEGGGSGTPYTIQGFLVPKPCSQLGSVPPGDPPNLSLAPLQE
jgi:hypothetical protein